MQTVSLLGCALILVGFAGLQAGKLQRERATFNLLNFTGSALLLWVAYVDYRVGFIVLEATWCVISLVMIAQRVRAITARR